MALVEILSERCKGCGLCVQACPKQNLSIGDKFNASGYNYVVWNDQGCTGCAFCAELCPDIAIRVYRPKKEKQAQKA
ncbi:MAG: 4Fe-4S dicluster domain-containing protein [Desulfarculus sp.]|nr:4Fe-4S dicluster domain-containing protein [Desulfarculus sp.]